MFLTDALALSHVPRWAIVRHSRLQSVADHSYRVAIIARELVRRLNWENREGLDVSRLVWLALVHDLDESLTGDIPAPAKKEMDPLRPYLVTDVPGLHGATSIEIQVLRLADYIEAFTFIGQTMGAHVERVVAAIRVRINDCLRVLILDKEQQELVWRLVYDIGEETGR